MSAAHNVQSGQGFIMEQDLREAYKVFADCGQSLTSYEWRVECRGEEQQYLAITRPLNTLPALPQHLATRTKLSPSKPLSEEPIEIPDDHDDEVAIHHTSSSPNPNVEYNIVFSQSYRVPVLYFFLHSLPSYAPKDIDTVYEYLVPLHTRVGLENVGVMGAVGMTNHPESDNPCFWVHPCRTAEAMGELLAGREMSAVEYLMLWIGLVGSGVGLDLPIELVLHLMEKT